MNPLIGLILYVCLATVTSLVSSKKGRSGWRYLLAMLLIPIPVMISVSYGLGNSEEKGLPIALAAFSVPVIGFITALMGDSAEQAAVTQGEFGDYRKCPFCAESIRKEAVKCKHCHSELPASM